MGRRLLFGLLLSAWFLGVWGCAPDKPVEATKSFKSMRPGMPQAPAERKKP